MTDTEKTILKTSWARLKPKAHELATTFYARLFALKPEYRKLFKSDLEAQKFKLLATLGHVVGAVTWMDADWEKGGDGDSVISAIVALGRKHTHEYHVPKEAYAVVGEALLDALGVVGASPAETAVWAALYTHVSTLMTIEAGA